MIKISDGAKVFIKNERLNKYIFMLRDNKPNIPYPNTWEIPGGRIEKGETPIETINREVKEELDIPIYDIKVLDIRDIQHKVNNRKYNLKGYYFTANTNVIDLSRIELDEGQLVKFFSLEEITSKDNVVPIVKSLIKDYFKE